MIIVNTSNMSIKSQEEKFELGGSTPNQLISALEEKKIKVSEKALGMLRNGTFSTEEDSKTITLSCATSDMLTGKTNPSFEEICSSISKKGYKLCPAEMGAQLMLRGIKPPRNYPFAIAMEPIEGNIFTIETDLDWDSFPYKSVSMLLSSEITPDEIYVGYVWCFMK